MRDQAYWERWFRQRPKALEEARASVKDWYREAGVEKGERRAFKAALKALNPDGVKGKREKKPPRRGKGRVSDGGTPYGVPPASTKGKPAFGDLWRSTVRRSPYRGAELAAWTGKFQRRWIRVKSHLN